MRPSVALLVAALVGAECERAPPENFTPRASEAPVPAASASPPTGQAADAGVRVLEFASVATAAPVPRAAAPPLRDDGRCVQPTSTELPAAVPAGPAPGCPADPEGGSRKLPIVRVSFPDLSGVSVDAELVRAEHDTMRGLMYRKSLGAERGMLFDLRVRDDHKFWMHNTCIPLDSASTSMKMGCSSESSRTRPRSTTNLAGSAVHRAGCSKSTPGGLDATASRPGSTCVFPESRDRRAEKTAW